MNVDLREKVALVTGGARGIGLATARLLAANGASVVLSDLDEDEAIQAVMQIPNARPLRMDVSNQQEVESGIDWISSHYGHIDILVNNAGLNTLNHRVTIDRFPSEEWDNIMNVDLRGLFLVSRCATALMLQNGGGRVINIASVLGVVPARLQCAFTAAKAGVINLTRAMAIELAPRGILVNCVAPGSTLTKATEALFYGENGVMRENAQRMLSHVPVGRVGTPDEIANVIVFLAAPESSYITGQTLCVDGGWSAGGFMRDF
jgi:NAD(P)-dependent dehydrogenase (short-subunit alcohol dehydrogenase family)